ncbi:hypothetical protein CRG98_001549 [Punica granatum]|uniref:Cytochrome P450 78A5-like n=1 Tax=Punica granatum TaxID=22663 RepID=A0A2I0LB70_PUNGR|nr:hypothetical protein CRG98_001549 [Punica granatum]
MSSLELHPLFIIPATSSPVLSFQLFAFALISAAVFTLFYVPGGLAWALSRPQRRHIPGPSGLPVVGIVAAFLGPLTHRVLSRLAAASNAKKLMAFSVGFTRYVIASDPETAKEMLSSSAFADRPLKESAYELLFHRAMGFAPYGEYWRNLRRISATHLFSPRRIAASGPFRQEIGLKMVSEIESSMSLHGAVEIRRVLHFGSLNNVMKSVFGRCYDFHGNDIASVELKSLVREGYDLLGVFNWSDHFPILGWFDLQGVRRRCRKLVERVNAFVGNVIEEHRAKRAANGGADGGHGGDDGSGDFVDVLLDLEKENRLSDSDLVAVLWSVSDSDLPNLPYLRAIVKETLRIHPPGPLLSWARLAIHDTSVGQHFIPAGTTAMVNMWAITHDGSVWSDPDEFKPERFVEEDVPIMGSDLRLAPFGSGRRVCPGKAMGLATVELWLAQLLQNFKWVPSEECGVDLTEILKLSMEMKRSLVCKAIPREG